MCIVLVVGGLYVCGAFYLIFVDWRKRLAQGNVLEDFAEVSELLLSSEPPHCVGRCCGTNVFTWTL